MNLSELINEIISEWAYRCDDGMPNPKNKVHLNELSIVLSEMGLSHIKDTLIENLLTEKGKTPEEIEEADKAFTNPILNKKVTYKNANGESKEGIVGNLLRQPKESPGRKAAEAMLPPEGSPERETMNQELGGEGQPKKPEDGKEAGGGEEGGAPKEDPIKAAAIMFDPKADPAMGARLDREKAASEKLAKKDKENSEAEKSAEEPKSDNKPEVEFSEPTNPPPQNEKGVEKDGKIAGTTIETEPKLSEIDPKFLKEKSTEMNKYYEDFKEDKKKAEAEAMAKFGYTPEQVKDLKDDSKKEFEDEVKKNQQPTYNLCKVSLPNSNLFCSGNKGIPRKDMPQFKGEPVEGTQAWDVLQKAKEKDPTATEADGEPYFRQMLADKGVKVTDAEVPSESLKATQTELVGDKVLGMKSVLDAGPSHPAYKKMTAPLYVSKDGYVVDGHHRWAAITAYNMEHPDNPLPLKTMIIDQDIDEAIETSNTFANDFGVAAKSGKQTGADAQKQAEPPMDEPGRPDTTPAKDKSQSKEETTKLASELKSRKSSQGEELDVETTDNGSIIIGVEHGTDKESNKQTIEQIKKLPKDTKVMFVGEGGSKNDDGNIEFGGEQDEFRNEVKGHFDNAEESTWDENANVLDDKSPVYDEIANVVGGSKSKAKAAVWSNMYGQDGPDENMLPEDYLDDEGKAWLIDQAKKGGSSEFDGEVDWNNLTDAQQKDLYELNYRDDDGYGETEISKTQEAYNGFRQKELDRKIKEAEDNGYTVIAPVGNSHVDTWRKRNKKEENPQKEMKEENLQLAHELMLEMIYGFINEATYPKSDDGKFWVKGKSNGNVYTVIKPKPALHDVPTKTDLKKAQADTKPEEPTQNLAPTDFRPTPDMEQPNTTQPPTKNKKGKKNKELNQTKNTKGEFNKGNLSKDGVTDEQFAANKKIKPTPSQIEVSQIEKFFLDKNGNTKFPKKYIKVLARMLSTKPGGVTISDFTDASGAGTLSSTMGELLTLMAVTIKDNNEAKEFFGMLREHIKVNGKDSIIDIGWVNSAEKVRQTQFNRYDRKYGRGNWELDNMAWDVESEVEAMGMENYKQNKGFSTDVYAKVKVGGKYILDEISLKKEIKANLLNATSGRVADIMVRGLASDEDLVVYDDLNAKIDSLMGLKDAASKKEKAELVAQRDAIVEKYNVNVPDDVKVSKVQKKQRLLHEDFVKKGVGEVSGFLKKFCNKKDTKYRSGVLNTMKNALSQKDDYKPKVNEQLDSLCSIMPKGGFKTPQDYNDALKQLKIGDTSDIQKLNMGLMSAIAAENPQSQAAKSSKMIIKNSHNHSKAVREFLLKDPAARKGLLGSIREAFPLKALFEGEENMILGDVSVDKDVLTNVFGVDSYDQLEQKLTVRDTPPPPSIVYRVAGREDIPVAEIVSRPDGIGYGGSWKLIMAVHPDFAKKLKESNDTLNSKIK